MQPARKHSSSFKRLQEYLTKERDADTGELLLRGDVVMSKNLLGFDTAAIEMQGVASLNNRCKDAVCHYELAWPPGERPTRPQWVDCALHTMKALGYEGHQYMIVAHDDKKHFHIHIMLNKVHMETLRAHTPYRDWFTLDASVRYLEAKHGWTHTPGPMRWDEESKRAVLQSRSERNASRSVQQHPSGAAAQFEHYQDQESFQTYVRREIAPRVGTLLARRNVTWDDIHRLLSKAHLRLEKGESGGYTVLAVDHDIRVKASDVFRNNFAGKINRQSTEATLGTWTPASSSGYEADQQVAQHSVQHDARDGALREERKAQRHAERSSLMAEYNQYRNQQRAICKGLTGEGREARQHLMVSLRQRKKEIRASALSWPDTKVLLSQAAAQSVLAVRALKLAVQQRRQEVFPKNLRTWVAGRAAEGDARAAAQLRGWRYADQRNQRRLDARLEANAMHIGPPPDHDSSTDWADLAQQRLAVQQKQQALANQIAAPRIWKIDRKTGDVSYALNGRVSVIDRGRIVTVLNQDKAAVLFGLEMAIQKFGPRIACNGSVEWKRMVTKIAAQHGISVKFTDPEMQHALHFLQRLANPRQRQQERGGR
ncbi:MAG: TraI/MobA(P) family conjugative relaxase [Terracidiphilus sp.]